jgi:glycine hydroxymethyltransferase
VSDIVTTTTHKTLRGPRGGLILSREIYAKDIDRSVFPTWQGGPMEHVIAAKAVAFHEAMLPSFADYAERIIANARTLAEALTARGFRMVSGGTDNHLVLVDLRPKRVTGKDAEVALDAAGITTNKNMIPFDPEKPMRTSGLRLGTPAVTTRGFGEAEMVRIAEWIDRVVSAVEDEAVIGRVRDEVRELAGSFPMPG